MLETFTVATFTPHRGESFTVRATEQVVLALALSEITSLGSAPSGNESRRAPFSLLFHGPLSPILPQRTYRVEHEALGAFDLFLVPLGPDRAGQRYEAVFG
jgi:hypothetical protein